MLTLNYLIEMYVALLFFLQTKSFRHFFKNNVSATVQKRLLDALVLKVVCSRVTLVGLSHISLKRACANKRGGVSSTGILVPCTLVTNLHKVVHNFFKKNCYILLSIKILKNVQTIQEKLIERLCHGTSF